MTAWKYHWQSFQNCPKLATEKGTHHRPSRKGTWNAKKYWDVETRLFFCVLSCMSRGSHRELAINEGKSHEWSSDTTSSFVSTAWCSYCRGLPRTWFDLEAFVSFYYHFWHPCLNLCSGCRRVWRQSERRPEREVWARSFYIIAKRGKPNNQSQVGMVDFLDVFHDGIYLGTVQKAEISFESVQTDLVLA